MVLVRYNKKRGFGEMRITGHADFATYGHDIVCSSISTVFQTALIMLERLSHDYPQFITMVEDFTAESVNDDLETYIKELEKPATATDLKEVVAERTRIAGLLKAIVAKHSDE